MKAPGVDISLIVIWVVVAILAYLAWKKGDGRLKRGLTRGIEMFLVNGPRVVVALLAAGFLSYLLPKELIAAWLGTESGWQGILIGCLVGPFFPGGPLVIFPVLVALLKAGAGIPSVFAFLTAASVWGAHRIIMFEIPMMGPRFAMNRMIASLALPPLAGVLSIVVIRLLGPPGAFNP